MTTYLAEKALHKELLGLKVKCLLVYLFQQWIHVTDFPQTLKLPLPEPMKETLKHKLNVIKKLHDV